MTCRARTTSADEGRVLILVLGTVVVLAMLVAVVTDAARLYLARRALDAATDAAALAGVQAADRRAVYEGSVGADLPLAAGPARAAVARYLEQADVVDSLPGFALTEVVVTGTEVTVRTSERVRLPFVGTFTGGRSVVTVRSSATARNHLGAAPGPGTMSGWAAG